MSHKEGVPKVWQSSLRLRFLAIVSLALLPVSALSIWQGVERVRLDHEGVRQTLHQSALQAASDERNIFAAAEKLLQTLAKEDDIRLGSKGCQRRLEDSARGLTTFGNLVRVSAEGGIICAAVLPPANLNVTKFQWWKDALVRREFFVGGPYFSDALRRSVFAGVLPFVGADGGFEGTLNVAITVDWLTFVNERQRKLPPGAVVALFDKSGAVVASNAPGIAATVFAGSTELAMGDDGMRTARGPNDEAWSLTIAPVLQHEHYIGFAMRDSDLSRLSYNYVLVDLLLPVFMIILASLAIWLATQRLVIRWIDVLSRTATAYAAGHYAIRPQVLNDAPREFRDLGDTLSAMALAVQDRDHSLKDALAQKEVLIKEIHHRVKNTLQIVVSLLSLQANRVRDPTAQDVLGQARARINALALAHRAIYEQDLDGLVDLKPLLSNAIEQAQGAHDSEHEHLTVSVDVVECLVAGDAAMPLTLFVNEAMSNAIKHGRPEPDAGGHISVSLKPTGQGRMDLTITDDGEGFDAGTARQDNAVGIGLMTALARQVSGEVSIKSGKTGTVVTLNFPAICQAAA